MKSRSTAAAPIVLILALGSCAPAATVAPEMREVGTFVVRLGADTIAVERFMRNADRIEGRQVVRMPNTVIRDYVAAFAPDGSVARFDLEVRSPGETTPTFTVHQEFGADTVVSRMVRGDSIEIHRIPAVRGSIPFLGYAHALYELPFRRLRTAGGDSLSLDMVPFSGTTAFPLSIETHGTDTLVVRNIAGTSRARVDEQGRLLGWDGHGSTLDIRVDRAVALDVDALAAEYARRDAEARGLGMLSPRDTLQASVAGATISVAYGRPSVRGREIFGSVVPWNEVWRTGANQATELRTDRDLRIGGTLVPAGVYSIFTIPAPGSWTLIINRQSGQWGTEYDPAQDFARLPLQREAVAQPVEQLTISIEPREGGGVLRMAWADTQLSVPFTVEPAGGG